MDAELKWTPEDATLLSAIAIQLRKAGHLVHAQHIEKATDVLNHRHSGGDGDHIADASKLADATAALALLGRMRFACGDNGLRMQDELEQYLRGLAEDAARWRAWRELDEHAAADIAWHNPGKDRDAAIDAAMAQPLLSCPTDHVGNGGVTQEGE